MCNTRTLSVSFLQLEHLVEKLLKDVEEQEHEFILQATRSNYYDKHVLENAQKVLLHISHNLHTYIHSVIIT